jgi:hypothetical protein
MYFRFINFADEYFKKCMHILIYYSIYLIYFNIKVLCWMLFFVLGTFSLYDVSDVLTISITRCKRRKILLSLAHYKK